MASKEGVFVADIESGQVGLERGDSVIKSCEWKRVLTRTRSGLRVLGGEESTSYVPKSCQATCANVAIVIDRNQGIEYRDIFDILEKGYSKEKHLKPHSIKHFKPPRHPKGPALNDYDMRLVKEISEMAAKKKWARIERIRALKKLKVTKSSSSTSSATAMVVTILFFVIIVLQGVMGSQP